MYELATANVCAQSDYDDFVRKAKSDYDTYVRSSKAEYENFRQRCNDEYAAFMEQAWVEFTIFKGAPVPDKHTKPIPPVVISDDEIERLKPIDRPIDIQNHAVPIVKISAPKPVNPIEPIDDTPIIDGRSITFSLWGIDMSIRMAKPDIHLASTSEHDVAKMWKEFSTPRYNQTVADCLYIRDHYRLCDWAYLTMLRRFADTAFPSDRDMATLLSAYIFCQSGYQMRLGRSDNHLILMFGCDCDIYERSYLMDDEQKFYLFDETNRPITMFERSFPGEQPLSLFMDDSPMLPDDPAPVRTMRSQRYPSIEVNLSSNKNFMAYYDNYPTASVGGDFMTRWAIYAITPLSPTTQRTIYPTLRQAVAGMSELEAVERLLNWVQTSFVYGYDSEVWGTDRAFYPEETLFYPYSDCEDRAILFSRLVNDLTTLRVALIYCPGHLYTAVAFNADVKGDYVTIDGTRFTICDPTYCGATVGMSMPEAAPTGAIVVPR